MPYIKVGIKTVRFEPKEIKKWIDENKNKKYAK